MSRVGRAVADLERKISGPDAGGLDRLRLLAVPFVPEIRLYLAEDAIVWWARMEAEARDALPPPYWASAWAGGQAVARYVLDHPEAAAGQRVLDLGAGSGLAGIAAGMAGAAEVIANDVDPYALAAITLNARANGVRVDLRDGDLLDGDGSDADVVLAGDVLYDPPLARRVLRFLERVTARGARVLVGDPGRHHLPQERLEVVESYRGPPLEAFPDAELTQTSVLRPRR
ncbi:Predicted nicotinamide N-methyase [Micromonospora pattaloongensis]|uniref:Predicted nicotinamide N-methyase n=1 Tax=Micromonospora pattaloongensis TaxID=405436 RepID=A0A1H3QAB0_9ACTN|nr:50S ribosomal protein L11 methyltransferase [Micromonospora pattaloongensis]SDZ10190.1 Predicted nicotinamide N-methyase [Micromonospora pattaloongensis]